MMFLLGVIVPWCSPLGLRALLCVKPFMADLELSQVNGTLFPRKTSITQTMCSRLVELWRHISKARTHFETEPDTGFIGKGMTRHLNRLYNYFIKGFLGSLLIMTLFPLLCISVSISSIAFAIAAPLWMPFITVTLHVYMMMVYDLDCPDESRRNRYCILLEAVGWNIIMQGLIQPVVALIVASFICPVVSVLVLFVGVARYWLRLFWDSITFHLFIKKCGRVPASDSFAVKRIAGPGLALDYYFLVKPEQALAAFEAKMELDELQVIMMIVLQLLVIVDNTLLVTLLEIQERQRRYKGSFLCRLINIRWKPSYANHKRISANLWKLASVRSRHSYRKTSVPTVNWSARDKT